MNGLLAALGFLTRVPVPARVFDDAQAQRRSLPWYPLVGLLLGAALTMLAWCLRHADPMLAAAVVLIAWVVATGALHLDGLADSADAWIGGIGDRERTLEIMKDPRCGPAGVVALVLLLLLKFVALTVLLRHGDTSLWLAPLLARAALTALFLWVPYVRRAGLGSPLLGAPRSPSLLALAGTLLLTFMAGWSGLIALGAAVCVWLAWVRSGRRRIGGFTGDTAGALTEMTEAVVLLALALRA